MITQVKAKGYYVKEFYLKFMLVIHRIFIFGSNLCSAINAGCRYSYKYTITC